MFTALGIFGMVLFLFIITYIFLFLRNAEYPVTYRYPLHQFLK